MVDAGHYRLGRAEQHRFAEDRSSAGVGLQPPTVQPLGSSDSEPSLRSFRVEHSCRASERAALIAGLLLAFAALFAPSALQAKTLIGRANHIRDGATIVVNQILSVCFNAKTTVF